MNQNGNSRNKRVLVIDDHRSVQKALRKYLGGEIHKHPALNEAQRSLLFGEPRAGQAPAYEVDSAYNGLEGLEKVHQSLAENRPYAVAFVDIRLPQGWDGLETIAKIWKIAPDLQVVVCTGYSDYSWEEIVGRLGDPDNMAILRKPFEREEVLQLVYLLSRKWQREQAARHGSFSTESSATSPKVLLLEDDTLTLELLARQLRTRLPQATVLTARTVAEAQQHLADGPIDFFLLDVVVPDGSGIDFLCHVQTTQPEALVVMMTAQALGEYRAAAEHLGVLRFLEKPVPMDEIAGLIQARVQVARQAAAGASKFAATLTHLTTLDIIQLKCLASATTALDFFHAGGARGRLFFEGGNIVHAETQSRVGEAAFAEIVSWHTGRVEEISDAARPSRTISSPWQGLLLDTAHRLDERDQDERNADASLANKAP